MRFAIGISLLALLLAACGSNQPDLDPNLDVEALVAKSSLEMNALDSYHVRFGVTMRSDDAREEGVWEFDFVPPDTYRFVFYAEEGDERNVCETPERGVTCTPVLTTVTERSRFEVLYVGEFMYRRQCDGEGDDCGDWEQEPRPESPVFGPTSTYLPQWPIVALEMISDAEATELTRTAGVETVLVRGSVNMIRAVLENQRRVLEALGITSLSTECVTLVEFMDEEAVPETPQPTPTPTCRDLTFEETLAKEDSVAFQDENPATVDFWISPDDGYMRRLVIVIPPEEAGDLETTVTIDYTDFNEATVEAPE